MRLTWLSLAIVFLLTLVGTTLGSLGVSLAGLLRDGSQLSALTLVQAWADFITDTQILRFVYGFSLIWWLIVMAIAGYEQNRAKQLFRPDLEVPPDGI